MTGNTTDNSIKLRTDEVQLFISPEKNHFVYFAKAAPIVNIVFSGGGAKGIYYPGVVAAIEEEKGMREKIEAVAGSSVGAATAAFFAVGMSADKFKASGKVNFESLLHSDIDNAPIVGKDGKPMKNYIEEELTKCVLEFIQSDAFQKINLDDIHFPTDTASHATKEYFEFLQAKAAQKENLGTLLSPTFAMLNVLRQMAPEKFKDLTVTAVCCETGELVYFNAENTPNLPISLACRASASLPVFFETVGIYKNLLSPLFKDKKEEKFTFIDGGTYNNTPVDQVTHKQMLIPGKNKGENGQNLQTLVFVFGDDSAYGENAGETSLSNTKSDSETKPLRPSHFHRVPTSNNPSPLYDPSIVEETVRNNLVSGLINPEKKYASTQSEIDVLEKVRTDHMLRTIVIPVKDGISTVAFEKAMNESEQRIEEGYKVAKNYFDHHRDEAIYHNFDNIYALLLFMPIDELEELNNKKTDLVDADIISKVIDFRTNLDNKINKLNVNSNILIAAAKSLLPKGLPEEGKKLFENHIVNRLRELHHHAAADNLQQKYYERDHKKKPPLVNKILSGIKLTPSENLIIAETIEKHFKKNNEKFGSINMDKLKLADSVTQIFGMYYISCKQDNWGKQILELTGNKKKTGIGRRKLYFRHSQNQSDNNLMFLQAAFQVELANAVSHKKPIEYGPIAHKIIKDALDEPTAFGKFFISETFQTNEIAKKILRNTPSNLIKALVANCTTKEAKKIVEIVLNIPIENQSQILSREPGFSDDLYRIIAQKCKNDLSKKTTFFDMIFNSEAYQANQEAKETLDKIPQHLMTSSNQNLSNNKAEMQKRDSMNTKNKVTMDNNIITSHTSEDFDDTTIGASHIEESDPINLPKTQLISATM